MRLEKETKKRNQNGNKEKGEAQDRLRISRSYHEREVEKEQDNWINIEKGQKTVIPKSAKDTNNMTMFRKIVGHIWLNLSTICQLIRFKK